MKQKISKKRLGQRLFFTGLKRLSVSVYSYMKAQGVRGVVMENSVKETVISGRAALMGQ